MTFIKQDRRHGLQTPRVLSPLICGFLLLFLMVGIADARRRHFRARYAPPSSAMAIDLYTGRILYSKNANEPRYPASLTKVMTLYLLFDALRDGRLTMQSELKVSAHAAAQSPTKLDLSEGDTISVEDAIGAIVTKSANDVAVVIAEALAPSEEEFARRMTQKARTIGMLNTTFRNASGLPNPDQRTTAQDLIILGKSILADYPERSKVFSTRFFEYDRHVYRNHNTMLFTYAGMEGMKTGFTTASGFNLIATARRGDKRVLAVVLGGASSRARNAAMRNILDQSWPKALTQVAARKAGIELAEVKPRQQSPAEKQPERQKLFKPESIAVNQPRPAPAMSAAISAISQIGKKPDRVSGALLLSALELGLASPMPGTETRGEAVASGDMTTDEPEEREEKLASSQGEGTANGREVVKSEAPVMPADTQPVANMSVHYKTVRPQPVEALVPAAIGDTPSEMSQAQEQQVTFPPEKDEAKEPQTLATATEVASRAMDQPGPYHIQVGAFPDQAEAEERLENVKRMLGSAMIQAHPEFIMQVALPQGTMYRARLGRFANESQAKSACRKLRHSGIECWDIRAQ